MNALIFSLGAVSAMVVTLVIVMVVVVLKLKGSTDSLKVDVQNLYQLRDSDLKDLGIEKSCAVDSIYRELTVAKESCNKYTDSRIDKLTEKFSKN